MVKKAFSTLAVASAATGIALGDGLSLAKMSEIAAHVLGHPVWTHELADKQTTERVHALLAAQFPNLPSRETAKADWRAAGKAAVDAYGPFVEVEEGTEVRSEGPIESLARITGRPEAIIPIVIGEEPE